MRRFKSFYTKKQLFKKKELQRNSTTRFLKLNKYFGELFLLYFYRHLPNLPVISSGIL